MKVSTVGLNYVGIELKMCFIKGNQFDIYNLFIIAECRLCKAPSFQFIVL